MDFLIFYGADKKHIFVLIRASIQQLRAFAEYTEYNLLLSEERLRVLVESGDEENGISPLQIAYIGSETTLFPYQYIYGPYRSDISEDIYRVQNQMDHPFSSHVRLRLTQEMVETISLAERHAETTTYQVESASAKKPKSRLTEMKDLREQLIKDRSEKELFKEFDLFDIGERKGSFKLTLRQHILRGNISAFFPLHNHTELETIKKKCEKWYLMPWQIPTNKLALYFGEKIALYFDFIGHYARWLMIPSAIGLPIQFHIFISGNSSTFWQVLIVLVLCSQHKQQY